jgi:hypothetical protein
MAVAALDQAFVHAMVEGHVEFGLLLEVATVAKLRLGLYEQEFPGLRMVRRMAGDAADIALGMQGIDVIHVLRAGRVAGQAAVVDFLSGMFVEDENLRLVAAPGHMLRAGTMATLASLP